jgi:GNAT superfamily N-acetyltransferase
MKAMKIREIKSTELTELLRLYEHLHHEDEPLPPQEDVAAVWESIQKNPVLKCFGLFIDAQLLSSCTLSIIPNLTRGCRPYGVIENVVTHAAHRRKGLGAALLKHVLSFAWEAGCYKVMLMTGRKDAGTSAFYASLGFDASEKQAFVAKPRAEQALGGDSRKPARASS